MDYLIFTFRFLMVLMLFLTSSASADIIGTTGDVEVVDAPHSVRRGNFENTGVARVFAERAAVTADNITINAVLPGRYMAYASFQDRVIDNPPLFDTYFFNFDPVGAEEGFVDGSITFSQTMLGVIGRSLTMQETDGTLGAPGTLYPTNRFDRELEFQTRGNYDFFELSDDMRTLTFRIKATDIDQFRIVVASVPEPGSLVLLASLPAFLLCQRKTNRQTRG